MAGATKADETTYHHGDLPTALRAATAELISERGPNGFSLREVARRAGVSHAAPAHHFGDSMGLLTSVATEGFQTLNAAFDAATEGLTDPVERLNACGKAYVLTAVNHPGHFGVMCAQEIIDKSNVDFIEASVGAYTKLLEAITAIGHDLNPDLDVESAATMTWSMVHGLAVLAPGLSDLADKTGTKTAPLEELINEFTKMLISGFASR